MKSLFKSALFILLTASLVNCSDFGQPRNHASASRPSGMPPKKAVRRPGKPGGASTRLPGPVAGAPTHVSPANARRMPCPLEFLKEYDALEAEIASHDPAVLQKAFEHCSQFFGKYEGVICGRTKEITPEGKIIAKLVQANTLASACTFDERATFEGETAVVPAPETAPVFMPATEPADKPTDKPDNSLSEDLLRRVLSGKSGPKDNAKVQEFVRNMMSGNSEPSDQPDA